jgi:hypothetical protein
MLEAACGQLGGLGKTGIVSRMAFRRAGKARIPAQSVKLQRNDKPPTRFARL